MWISMGYCDDCLIFNRCPWFCNKEKDENNAMPKLILEPTAVVARDDKDAALKIAMKRQST